MSRLLTIPFALLATTFVTSCALSSPPAAGVLVMTEQEQLPETVEPEATYQVKGLFDVFYVAPWQPTGISVSDKTTTSATITWNTAGKTRCYLQYGKGKLTTTLQEADKFTRHAMALSGLVPNTTYKFRVTGVQSDGFRFPSSLLTFKTLKAKK